MFSWITGIAMSGIAQLVGSMLFIFGTAIGTAISWLANLLNYLVHVPVYPTNNSDIAIIRESWTIFRDISNMFFIIVLVVAAFATIFDIFKQVGPYSLSRDFITRFIISAVLINFSFVIGVLIIDFSQIISNVFLTAIGDISVRLGQAWNPASLFQTTFNQGGMSGSAFSTQLSNSIVGLAAMVIFLFVYAGSIFTAVVFTFLRIPILWALLIVSPVAWLAYLLPFSKKWFTKWWDFFIGWNLFLPYFLLIMYFALLVLTKQAEVWPKIAKEFAAQPPSTLGNISIPFQDIVRYGIVCATLIFGTRGAMNFSMFSKAGIGKTVAWGKQSIWGINQVDAAIKALGAKGEEIKKTGLPGRMNLLYGGQAEQERREATWKQRFGVKGSDKEFVKNAGQAFEKIEDAYDTGKLDINQLREKVKSTNASSAEGYAYRKLAVKKGALGDDQFNQTLSSVAMNPFMVQDLMKTAKEAKFAGIKDLKKVAFNKSLPLSARRDVLSHMASESKQAGKFNITDIEQAVDVLGGKDSPETRKFLDDVGKVRAADVNKVRGGLGILEKPTTEEQAVRKSLNTEPKNIAAMPDDVWASPSFKTSLKDKLYDTKVSPKVRANMRNRLEQILNEQGADEKLRILNEQAPRKDFQRSEPSQGHQNQPQGGRGRGTGGNPIRGFSPGTPTSNVTSGVSEQNTINLRNPGPQVGKIEIDEDTTPTADEPKPKRQAGFAPFQNQPPTLSNPLDSSAENTKGPGESDTYSDNDELPSEREKRIENEMEEGRMRYQESQRQYQEGQRQFYDNLYTGLSGDDKLKAADLEPQILKENPRMSAKDVITEAVRRYRQQTGKSAPPKGEDRDNS